MSRTVGISRLDAKLAVTPRDSSSSSDKDEPSETTNSVHSSNDDDSHNRGGSSVRWFSSGADSSFTTSPRVSPSGVDGEDAQQCDEKIQRLQRLHMSKGVGLFDFFASCDTNWKPETDYKPEQYVYGPVPTHDDPEQESSDFYDDTLASTDTQMTKRSTVMISSFSKSINFLLQQEAIEMDIPKSPTVSIVLSDSEFSEFAVSADESEIELRDAVNNIVQTLDVTGATGTGSVAASQSGSVISSSKFCIKEEKHVDPLADARGDTSGHQMASVGVVKQERDDPVAIRNPIEQSDDERQRNDDPILGEAVTVSEPVSPVIPCGRPIGQKAAKHKLRMDEVERSKIIVLEEMAQATKERNEIMRQANRIKIVTTSLNDLDEISTKILELEKQKILYELLLCGSDL